MADIYDLMANAVTVIREDQTLKDSFNKILGAGIADQRVPLLLQELAAMSAPERIIQFAQLLTDDRIAALVLQEINRE